MHNGDMQDLDNLAHHVHNRHPHAYLVNDSDSMCLHLDYNRLPWNQNRSRNRRTW